MTIEDLKRIKKDFPGNQVIIRLGSGRRIILRRSTDLGVTDTKIVFTFAPSCAAGNINRKIMC